MFETLIAVEKVLPEMLLSTDGWNSLFADSKKPHLRRMWRQWNEYRICLHHFSECTEEEEFPHPHPWKMAVRVLEGRYSMGLGRGDKTGKLPKLTYSQFSPGDSYKMTEENLWHAIRPIGKESLSLMISGPVIWPQHRVHSNDVSRALTPEEQLELLERFRRHYPIKG